jgi:hypothetical protein
MKKTSFSLPGIFCARFPLRSLQHKLIASSGRSAPRWFRNDVSLGLLPLGRDNATLQFNVYGCGYGDLHWDRSNCQCA